MTVRTLSPRELNRALLARQMLLERAALPVPRALERLAGLQTQYAPSGYIGLFARLAGFSREDLTRALERRSVVQGTLHRVTIHMVSARDYPYVAAGIRMARRGWWLKVTRHRTDAAQMRAVARRVARFLAGGPRERTEIVEALGLDNATVGGAGLWVDLLRVPPSGTWDRRRADRYALASQWLDTPDPGEAAGIRHLARRYLAAFGPSTRKDLATWAGLPVAGLEPALARMRLRRFVDERGAELLDLPGAPLPLVYTPSPVLFMPTLYAMLLVHVRGTQILPDEHRPKIFDTKIPHSVPTFLVDGRVAGTWGHERGEVRPAPFAPLPRAVRQEVDAEADALTRFMA